MKKTLFIFLILVSTLFFVGMISYRFAENVVCYDYEKNVIKNEISTELTNENFNENIDKIPYAESYLVKIINDRIIVYDNRLNTVYQTKTDMSAFTSGDLKQLEQDGITLTARSDLIELLNYICS